MRVYDLQMDLTDVNVYVCLCVPIDMCMRVWFVHEFPLSLYGVPVVLYDVHVCVSCI